MPYERQAPPPPHVSYISLIFKPDFRDGTLTFQEYYLILLLVAALIYASFIHPRETWVMAHGISYLVGFPAMQILLPIYAICNIVDMSWGTRDQVSTIQTAATPLQTICYYYSVTRRQAEDDRSAN